MIRKLVNGTVVTVAFVTIAAAGNPDSLRYPQLWILAALAIAAQVFQPLYKAVDRSAPPQDRGTGNHLVWSVYLSQAAGMIEAVYFRYPSSFDWDLTTTMGLLFACAGLFLRSWAVHELGKFFTWHILVQPDQRVITTGPYRIMRDPGYCGAWIMWVFTLIFIHAWVAAVLATLIIFGAIWRRIRYEEPWLRHHLGEQYTQYASQVKGLIPYVW